LPSERWATAPLGEVAEVRALLLGGGRAGGQGAALADGDVVVATERPVGGGRLRVDRASATGGQASVGLRASRVARVTARPTAPRRLCPAFLYYALSAPAFSSYLRSIETGTSVPHVSAAQIAAYPLPLPPLADQQAIGRALGAIDAKIAANAGVCGGLEAMIQALFDAWMVRFEPARQAPAGARGQAGEGAPLSAVARLFPDGFESSDRGPVPRGFRVRALTQIAVFTDGLELGRHPPRGEGDEGLPIIRTPSLRALAGLGRPMASLAASAAPRATARLPPEHVADDGDVLFSWSGSLEVALWAGGRGAVNQHVFKVASAAYPRWLHRCWLLHHLPSLRATAQARATTLGHVQRRHLDEALVALPPAPLLRAMDAAIAPLEALWLSEARASHSLAALRDALLPQLLSGERRPRHSPSRPSAYEHRDDHQPQDDTVGAEGRQPVAVEVAQERRDHGPRDEERDHHPDADGRERGAGHQHLA
jgi:type I restriction enzyme, S subunit